MFHSRAIVALTLISLSWTSVTARAATLSTTMSVGATYDLAGNTQSSSSLINDGTPHIYRVDIFGQVSGLATNESFGAELYNLTLSGSSLSRNTVSAPGADLQTPKPNYVANNPALVNIADGTTSCADSQLLFRRPKRRPRFVDDRPARNIGEHRHHERRQHRERNHPRAGN